MNIFVLDTDPVIAAQLQCDKHVVKMILETAQLLCTAHRVLDKVVSDVMYKKTHENHPCAIWVRESTENYEWTYQHFLALCDEYTFRYKKTHLTDKKMRELLKTPPINTPIKPMTKFKLAMGTNPECIGPDPVLSYKKYYTTKLDKFDMRWTARPVPAWMQYGTEEYEKLVA